MRSPAESPTHGSAPASAAPWRGRTTRRTSTPSASTASNPSTSSTSPACSAPCATTSSTAASKATPRPTTTGSTPRCSPSQPTNNFQFGFQRTVIFGGEGHEPVTLHTFLKGFFDTNDTSEAEKFSRDDPGARFSAFTFSYRLPFVRNYLTLYADSESHDDLTPVSAPRRAAYRPGLYLSRIPGIPRLDLRVEGVSTNCSTLVCINGSHEYIEDAVQRQAYTNKGNILGDWIGREAIGGQAWLTWHLSGNEWVDVQWMHKQNAKRLHPRRHHAKPVPHRRRQANPP